MPRNNIQRLNIVLSLSSVCNADKSATFSVVLSTAFFDRGGSKQGANQTRCLSPRDHDDSINRYKAEKVAVAQGAKDL